MKLNKTQKSIISNLKKRGIPEQTIVCIILISQNIRVLDNLLKWLLDNPQANEEEILGYLSTIVE